MTSKRKIIAIACLTVICLTCLIFSMVTVTAQELPTVDSLFDGQNVTFTKQATDGKTDQTGLLLTANKAGASAQFKLDLSQALNINLKTLNGSVPKFHIVLTDVYGQEFSIQSLYKTEYDDISVELNGNRGGIYQFSDKWDMKTGYTAAYNNIVGTYTQFWRTYSKENRNDIENPITADTDCLHLQFDVKTMQVGVRRFAVDPYLLVWDLSEQINDGHDIGSTIDYFGDYTFKIVFDDVVGNNGQLLIYSINDYDLSQNNISAENAQTSIAVPVVAKAQNGVAYAIPQAIAKSLQGDVEVVAKVGDEEVSSYTPTSGDKFTITYTSENYSRNVEIPVLSSVTSSLDDATIPASVGVNQRIQLPASKITTNLSIFDTQVDAEISVKDGENQSVALENDTFVANKAGNYTITYTALGGKFEKQFVVNANDANVGINYQVFAQVYRVGHTLSINNASAYKNGTALDVITTIKFPSGKIAQSGQVVLDETGDYTVIHSYQDGGDQQFTQAILVEESAEDLFVGDAKVKTSYGVVEGNNDFSGAKLSFEGNGTVEYQKVIDLSDNRFDPETKTGDLLLELVVQPAIVGTADLEKIELFFTDVNDSSNVMSVSLAYYSSSRTVTKILAKATGQPYTARRTNGEYSTVVDAGFNARHSFIQTVRHDGSSINGEFENYTLKLYYDYKENALYGTPEWNKDSYLILDFDDTNAFPTNPWSGFSDGKVKMSIKVSGVSSVATMYVFNVDGSTLDGETFTDIKAPSIESNISGSTPLAAVNKPYPLLPFDAFDLQSGIAEKWWKVTDKNGVEQPLTNGAFTPTTVGKYIVTMFAKDYFGNVTSKDVYVTAISYVAGVVLNIEGEVLQDVLCGQYVELPEYSTDSGAGQTSVTISVTKDGVEIPVEDFKFYAGDEGTYVVTYKAVDHIGNVNTKSFFVSASFGGKPTFDQSQISLPVAFINGETYVFDNYQASFFAGVGATQEFIPATITVTDANGTRKIEGNQYLPVVVNDTNTVDQITVKFVFEKSGYEPLEIEKTVPAINPVAQTGYMSKYFLMENGTATSYSNGIVFSATSTDDMIIKYVRPLSTHNLSIKFVTTGYVTEQLTNEQIAQLQSVFVGEGKEYATNDAFDEALSKKVVDANGNETDEYEGVTYNGNKYYKVRRYYLRDVVVNFRNYSSIDITLQDSLNPAQKVTISYARNGQQFISNVCGKLATANINSGNEFFLRYDNETNTVSDALNAKLGELTTNDAGKDFAGFSSGNVYVTIRVKDIVGDCSMLFTQMNNHAFNDNSQDNITPVLWLNGTIDGRYMIGSTAVIPTADAYDVLSAISMPTVTITAPDGKVLLKDAPADIEYKLTLGQYGTYMIVYNTQDAVGNAITTTKSLLVTDDRAPTLNFSGNVPTSAKVGDTINLPSYTIVDNAVSGVTVDITLRTPNGQYANLDDGKVTFDRAGIYTINYFVIDADFNSTVYSYTIVVAE